MKKHLKICTFVFVILTVFSIVFILSNSLKNGEESYEQSKGLVDLIESIFDPNDTISTEDINYFVRKVSHILEFALLGFSVAGMITLICYTKGNHHISLPLLCGLLVAVIDEFIQSFTGRTSSVSDVIIDFVGVICGVLIGELLVTLKIQKSSHTSIHSSNQKF